MIKTTGWAPEHICSCVFIYQWNTDDDQETRVHTPISMPRRCPRHSKLTLQECFDTVLAESGYEQAVKVKILSALPDQYRVVENGVGTDPTYAFLYNPTWQFGADLDLTVDLGSQVSEEAKACVRTALQAQFGKVIVL